MRFRSTDLLISLIPRRSQTQLRETGLSVIPTVTYNSATTPISKATTLQCKIQDPLNSFARQHPRAAVVDAMAAYKIAVPGSLPVLDFSESICQAMGISTGSTRV